MVRAPRRRAPAAVTPMRFLPPIWRLAAPAMLFAAAVLPQPARGQQEPHYWRQRVFFIPYQASPQDPLASKIEKVQLLVSRDGGQTWAVLQEAEPHVRGFSYHAASDGEYAFALRMSDRRGKIWPEQITQPLLRIVVDTQPPALQLAAALDATGQVVVKYEARDAKLKTQTLRLEVETGAGGWQRLAVGPPDLLQPDRLVGQLAWRPPTARGAAKFRAAVEDAAGNQITAATEASLIGPMLDPALGPQLAPPSVDGPEMVGPSFDTQAARPAGDPPRTPLDWPSNNRLVVDQHSPAPPPYANTYTANASAAGVPAFNASVATGAAGNSSDSGIAPVNREDEFSSPGSAPLSGDAPALLPTTPANDNGGWTQSPSGPSAYPASPFAAASTSSIAPPSAAPTASRVVPDPGSANATTPAAGSVWVNSLTFDLDYDIQTVGPWGVAKVELWGTKDAGRTWQSLGVDQDNRSPLRVTVPAAGVYGFRILVDGGNGVAAPPPRSGETPELVVGVDLAAPQVELRVAEPGQAPFAGQVIIRWSAQDENLAPRPIGLFHSASAEGPWSTIATDIDNTGEYAWRLGREAPPQVFVRLEVRDLAGNVEVRQSPSAINLNLPRPTGRLRNVRPVEADPDRYRTASGPRAEG
jgi:hypothetical protein